MARCPSVDSSAARLVSQSLWANPSSEAWQDSFVLLAQSNPSQQSRTQEEQMAVTEDKLWDGGSARRSKDYLFHLIYRREDPKQIWASMRGQPWSRSKAEWLDALECALSCLGNRDDADVMHLEMGLGTFTGTKDQCEERILSCPNWEGSEEQKKEQERLKAISLESANHDLDTRGDPIGAWKTIQGGHFSDSERAEWARKIVCYGLICNGFSFEDMINRMVTKKGPPFYYDGSGTKEGCDKFSIRAQCNSATLSGAFPRTFVDEIDDFIRNGGPGDSDDGALLTTAKNTGYRLPEVKKLYATKSLRDRKEQDRLNLEQARQAAIEKQTEAAQAREAAKQARMDEIQRRKDEAAEAKQKAIDVDEERRSQFINCLTWPTPDFPEAERLRRQSHWSNKDLADLINVALRKITSGILSDNCDKAGVVRKHFTWLPGLCIPKRTEWKEKLFDGSCKLECDGSEAGGSWFSKLFGD